MAGDRCAVNKQFLAQTLRDNWYLFLALLIFVAAIGFRIVMPGDSELAEDQAAQRPPTAGQPLVLPPEPAPAVNREAPVRTMIDDYRQRVESDPEHPDSAATLMAIGNLYRDRLMDYGQAAAYYEQTLNDYPDTEFRRDIYIQLADCYDRLGDFELRDAVYRDMLDFFPEDSEEHLFARAQLGG